MNKKIKMIIDTNKDERIVGKDKENLLETDKKTMETKNIKQAIIKLLIKIFIVVFLVVGMFTFIFGLYRVNDIDMEPAVIPGDLALFYRLDKNCIPTDVVVIEYKGAKTCSRVVAVEGDYVDINEKGLYINGNKVYEPKIYSETLAVKKGIKYPLRVGENEIFILGDNRKNSVDSRLYGPVEKSTIYGKLISLFRRRDI
ncbi:signal peptidase I [Peptostreptococcus equinus]|uniref:Signal peptidase I n=1 Tax=Peptostreptococcus equinus TaxID=3003601 RepID=A0ABY7JNT6_9FIRM|nr:signal peptidase I [Peptostreptococcus sp. CBA3647]WAW14131.1 signal peptidase I [Peptostreptococcus sp. CBA3647]